jgi:type VI secretion system secreted protein VgrG
MVTMLLNRTAMFVSPLKEQVALYSMNGREAVSRPFVYEVDLLSQDDSIDFNKILGQTASVMLERTDGTLREFNGFVTHFSLIGEHGNYARYRAVMRPWLWFLGQNLSSRVFQPDTVPKVVTALFREYGFSDIEESLAPGAYRKWDYLIQYRESDLNFVSRLLEQEGIFYFFKHAKGKHTIVLADANTAFKAADGFAKVPYFPPLANERRQEEHLDTWVTSRQIRPGGIATREFHFTKPKVIESELEKPLKTGLAKAELYDYPGQFTEDPEIDAKAEADTLVRIRLQEHQVEHELVQAGGAVRGLMAGNRFKLTQFPRDDQNKDWVIVSASYELQVSEFESNVAAEQEAHFRFELVATDAEIPYRPPRVTKKPVVEGPQTAIVVGKDEQEIYTDEYGRIKVQFHWDRTGTSDENSSCWMRVSQLWAGQQWGAMHIPRVGQEVIVQFLEGDPDRPIVTGRVYNQENMPPYTLPDNKTQSGIKSRSSSGGAPDNFNEIRFEDKKGSEEFFMQAEKNMTISVKNNQSTSVTASRSASVGGNDSVSVTGDRSLSVHGNLSVTVDGAGKSPVHSTMNVTGKHTLDATDTIEIQAPTHIKLTVGGSSIMITPAAITITAGGGASVALTGNVAAASKAGSSMTLDDNAKAVAKTGASLTLDATVVAKSKQNAELKLESDATVTSPTTVKLDGKDVKGVGKSEASLTVADQSVKVTPASVDTAGKNINVNGMTMVTIAGPTIKIG